MYICIYIYIYIYGIYMNIFENQRDNEPIQLIHNPFSVNQKTFFEMTHLDLYLSQIHFIST